METRGQTHSEISEQSLIGCSLFEERIERIFFFQGLGPDNNTCYNGSFHLNNGWASRIDNIQAAKRAYIISTHHGWYILSYLVIMNRQSEIAEEEDTYHERGESLDTVSLMSV